MNHQEEGPKTASLSNRVQALVDMKRYPEALEYATKNVAHYPEDSYAVVQLADVYFRLDDIDAALDTAGRAVGLNPDNDYALSLLAWCKLSSNHFTEALDLARAAVKIDPEDSSNLQLLAVAEYHCGNSKKAMIAARRGIELDPENGELHGLLADLIYRIDKPKQALIHYREALKHDPENAGLHASLAEAYASTGVIPAAIDSFVRAVKLDPQDDEIRQKLFGVMHHHLLNLPQSLRHEIIDQLGPSLSLFYQQALTDKTYVNKMRLPTIMLLWVVVILAMTFVMALISGEDVAVLGNLAVVGLSGYAMMQLWQWLANWRLKKKFLRER